MSDAPTAVRQVTAAEAAVLLGVSVDTIKRRVRSGALHSNRTAQGRVLVDVPEEEVAPQAAESAPQEPPSAPHAAPQVHSSDDELAALQARVTAVTAERDWLRDRVVSAETEREQLRILLGNAQQSLALALQAAPVDDSATEARTEPVPAELSTPAPAPSAPLWGRLWPILAVMAVALVLAGVLLFVPR
jgi:hypothetical protein